jgi:hypothetical protein
VTTPTGRPSLDSGRQLEIDAEKLRKRGDLVPAGAKIGEAAVHFLKALCEYEKIPCQGESQYFAAAAEIARRLRQQTINKQFGLAMLLRLNAPSSGPDADSRSAVALSGDQIKTYFKDVQKLIHLIHDRLRRVKARP